MTDAPATRQELIDAGADARTVTAFVNGAADVVNPGHANGTFTTRLGATYKTLANIIAGLLVSTTTATDAAAAAQGYRDQAQTAAANVATAVGAVEALPDLVSDYVGTITTYGATPTAGTSADPIGGNTMYQGTFGATTVDGYLDTITVWVKVVGSGALRLDVRLAYTNTVGTMNALYQRINIAGITATGLQTFSAGTHFPHGIAMLKGSKVDIGMAAGGAQISFVVDLGNGDTRTYGGGGYNVNVTHGFNYVPLLQITTTTKYKTIAQAIDEAQALAALIAKDGAVTEYTSGDDGLLSTAGWGGGYAAGQYPNGTYPVLRDSIWKGVEYNCVAGDAGDCYFFATRNGVEVGHWRATLVVGQKMWVAAPTGRDAILLKKGDIVFTQPVTGTVAQRGYTAQGSYFAASNYLFTGMAYTNDGSQYNRVGCFRVVSERPRTAREAAQFSSRGSTQTLRETFPGVTLPKKWANGPGAAWTCNDGLVSPAAPAASWNNYCAFSDYTNAHRRTSHAMIDAFGSADNIGGVMWLSQQASTLPMGTIAVIDGPGALLRVYRGGNPGPLDAGLSTAFATPAPTDKVLISCDIDRDVLTVIARNVTTGVTAKIVSQTSGAVIYGGYMRGRIAAVLYSGAGGMKVRRIGNITRWARGPGSALLFQDSTADNAGGMGGYNRMPWMIVEDQLAHGNLLNCSKSAADSGSCLAQAGQDFIALLPQAATCEGSIAAGTNTLTVTACVGRITVGDLIHGPGITPGTTITAFGTGTGGVGTYTTSGAVQTVAATTIAVVARNAAAGVEVFWGTGVNPRHGGGESDALWYASYRADTLAMAAIVTGAGAKFTVLTIAPANYISTYVKLHTDNLRAGDLGDFDIIDPNRRVATSLAAPGTWLSTTMTAGGDGLHYDPIYTAVNVANDILEQRPDLTGLAA